MTIKMGIYIIYIYYIYIYIYIYVYIYTYAYIYIYVRNELNVRKETKVVGTQSYM